MHAKAFRIALALTVLMPAALAAQQPGVTLPPAGTAPAPLVSLPVPAPGTATAALPEIHDVYRRNTDERGQRPRQQRRRLRRQAGQRRGEVPPLLGPDGNVRGAPGAGQPLAPRPPAPMLGTPEPSRPAPDPPPG